MSKVNPDFYISYTPLSSLVEKSSFSLMYLKAKHKVLNDFLAILTIDYFIYYKFSGLISFTSPVEANIHLLQADSTIYEAPFKRIIFFPSSSTTVLILFLSELKGIK